MPKPSMPNSAPPKSSDAIVDLYTRHATAWDTTRGRGTMERAWLDRFLDLVPMNGSVLDIGCGGGQPIAEYVMSKGRQLMGVDTSPPLVSLCRQRFPGAQFHVADMRTLSLATVFDGLLAWDSFFHLDADDQRTMFPIFARHAAPGAALMFTSGPAAGEAIGVFEGEPLYHASLDPAEYRELLAGNGFTVSAMVTEDESCGRHTVWLAVRDAA